MRSVGALMSAIGTKRTSPSALHMPTFDPSGHDVYPDTDVTSRHTSPRSNSNYAPVGPIIRLPNGFKERR
jgi:hypothetical protein